MHTMIDQPAPADAAYNFDEVDRVNTRIQELSGGFFLDLDVESADSSVLKIFFICKNHLMAVVENTSDGKIAYLGYDTGETVSYDTYAYTFRNGIQGPVSEILTPSVVLDFAKKNKGSNFDKQEGGLPLPSPEVCEEIAALIHGLVESLGAVRSLQSA